MMNPWSRKTTGVAWVPLAAIFCGTILGAIGLSPNALADSLSDVTGAVPDLGLGTVQGTATGLLSDPFSTATSLMGDGRALSSGFSSDGLSTNNFFLPNDGFRSSLRDPNTSTYLPVKAGMALFTAKAGKFRIEFNYAGRFNGDFEEHQAGFKIRVKIPPF